MDKLSCAKRQTKVIALCQMVELFGWQEVKVRHLWAIIMGSMNRLCGVSMKVSQIPMQVLLPALRKAQKSHSSPVSLILKQWKKRVTFGSRTKHRKSGRVIGEKSLRIYQRFYEAPWGLGFQPPRAGLRNSKEDSASIM